MKAVRFVFASSAVLSFIMMLSLSGCENAGAGAGTEDTPTVNTVSWEPDGNGSVHYRTNDEEKLNSLRFVTYSALTTTNRIGGTSLASMKRVARSAGDADGNGHDTLSVAFKTGGETSFTEETAVVDDDTFGLGAKGFIVQIAGSDDESFPDEPVDVRFKMRQPASIP